MKKPNPKAYGQDNELWEKGGKEAYEKAYLNWAEYRTEYGSQSGWVRLRPIHPSWSEVLKHFDSTNPLRSQGAFCRWAKVNRASFSTWKTKELHEDSALKRWIILWAKEKEVENG